MSTAKMEKLQVETDLQAIADMVCAEHGVPVTPVNFKKYSDNKSGNKLSGRYNYTYNFKKEFEAAKSQLEITEVIISHKISLSEFIYKHFEIGESIDTLMHELAHHIRLFTCKDLEDHSEGWETIYINLCETMDTRLAVNELKKNMSNKDNKKLGVKYSCQCGKIKNGEHFNIAKPEAWELKGGYCPKCGNSLQNWKMTGNKELIAEWSLNNPEPVQRPLNWQPREVKGYNY